jgi:hypothetical protein
MLPLPSSPGLKSGAGCIPLWDAAQSPPKRADSHRTVSGSHSGSPPSGAGFLRHL